MILRETEWATRDCPVAVLFARSGGLDILKKSTIPRMAHRFRQRETSCTESNRGGCSMPLFKIFRINLSDESKPKMKRIATGRWGRMFSRAAAACSSAAGKPNYAGLVRGIA